MGLKFLIDIPQKLACVLQELPFAYLVGGSVRDALLGNIPKDLDIEVYQTNLDDLVKILEKVGKVDQVGRSFGVIKLTLEGQIFDFSLPRRDSKLRQGGHKGFSIEIQECITPQEAASRRDLTINSLAYNPKTNEILDFHGGLKDLDGKILRHTSPAFTEDPLRVLRVMQFAARFDFDIAPETIELSRSIKETYNSLAKERVNEEFTKMLLKGVNIRRGLNFLKDTQWIEHFPELQALDRCPKILSGTPKVTCCNTPVIPAMPWRGSCVGRKRAGFQKKRNLSSCSQFFAMTLASPVVQRKNSSQRSTESQSFPQVTTRQEKNQRRIS
jgi:tRNA nucleotidyltransferase (CCA-adding enzyme)